MYLPFPAEVLATFAAGFPSSLPSSFHDPNEDDSQLDAFLLGHGDSGSPRIIAKMESQSVYPSIDVSKHEPGEPRLT